jgi:hypothetical protein
VSFPGSFSGAPLREQPGRQFPGLVESPGGAQFDVDLGRLGAEQVGEDAFPVVGVVEEQQQVAQADQRVGSASRAGQRVRPPVHVAHYVNSHVTTVRPAGFPMASAGWSSGNGRPAA